MCCCVLLCVAQLARGGIREHEAFWGHERRGPAGTGRGGVSVAGGWQGQGEGEGGEVMGCRLPFCLLEFTDVYLFSVLMKEIAIYSYT